MVALSGSGWRLAPCLVSLMREVDARWPRRSKASDGSIGDRSHSFRTSDHNPDASGWVKAVDITEDAANGPDLWALWNQLVRTRDPRVRYLIYESRIIKSYIDTQGRPAWVSQPYSGSNPHSKHMHISVRSEAVGHTGSWFGGAASPSPSPSGGTVTLNVAVLKRGSKGGQVKALQALLRGKAGQNVALDGDFGPATENAVMNVQKFFGIGVDGVVGQKTWGVFFL